MYRANLKLVATAAGISAAYLTVKVALRADQEADMEHRIRTLERKCKAVALEVQYRSARRGDLDTTDALSHAWGIRNRADVMAREVKSALALGTDLTPARARESALEAVRAYEQAVAT